MKSPFQRVSAVVGTAAAILVSASAAQAQVTVEGTSTGTFTDGGDSGLSQLGGLWYQHGNNYYGDHEDFWSPFILAAVGAYQDVTFGTLWLEDGVAFNYGAGGNKYFNLNLMFMQPAAGHQVFTAALSGNNNQGGSGQVNVNFNGPFDVAAGDYLFRVSVNSITGQNFGPGGGNNARPADVTGRIELLSMGQQPPSHVVPEPVTMLLLGTGLLGIGAVHRRRRRQDGIVEAA